MGGRVGGREEGRHSSAEQMLLPLTLQLSLLTPVNSSPLPITLTPSRLLSRVSTTFGLAVALYFWGNSLEQGRPTILALTNSVT